jgi:integrase
MGELEQAEEFGLFLTRKGLSEETKKLYTLYYSKLEIIMQGTGQDLNQEIVDAYLDLYPHIVARALLKNYLEFRDMHFKIQKRTGRVARKEVETISNKELQDIRQKLYEKDERYGLLFDLSEGCALRRQEAINIRAGDVSTEEIDGKLAMFILLKKTKGDKERRVFVPEQVAITLVKFMAGNNLTKASYLFRSSINHNRPIEKSQWNRAFAEASLNATGKKYHPHQLRHTRSLKWFDNGVDIVRIQQRLGHNSIATTRLYLNPDKRKELEKWSKEHD